MRRLNLISGRFWPVRCEDGSRALVSLAEAHATDDGRRPVGLDFADRFLNAVSVELLAGLLQECCPPDGPDADAAWSRTFAEGMGPAALRGALARLEPFFEAAGDMAAFQVREAREDPLSRQWPISRLRRDGAGGIEAAEAIGLNSALAAAYGLQAHAHSGGRGYGTSLSAGGPLRTVPRVEGSVFQQAWALVLPRASFERLGEPGAGAPPFPWAAPARAASTPADSPAATVYFATPRRLALHAPCGVGECPIGGGHGPLVSGVTEGPGGTDYPSHLWSHPLTPYRWDKDRGGFVPLRAAGYPHGMSWNDRVGVTFDEADKDGRPTVRTAEAVRTARTRMRRVLRGRVLTVMAYGQRFENADYHGPLWSEQPVRLFDDAALAAAHERILQAAVRGAEEAASRVRAALASAQLSDANTNPKARAPLRPRAAAQAAPFWPWTVGAFDAFDGRVADALEAAGDPESPACAAPVAAAREELLSALARSGLDVFRAALGTPSPGFGVSHAVARDGLTRLARDKRIRAAIGLEAEAAPAPAGREGTA